MADKTIGELPSLNTMEADTLIPVEHDGAAKSMSGTVLQNYIYSNVEDDVEVIAAQIATGPKGDDGFSPVVSTSKSNGVATVSITDADGDHTFTVTDGDVSKEFISSSSASGAVANFWRPAGGIPVNSLICDINPVQAGSGNPSPSNIRELAGFTQVDLCCAGRNLLVDNKVYPITHSNITTNRNADGSYQITGNKTSSSAAIFLFNFANPDGTSTTTQFDYKKWLQNGSYKAKLTTEGLPSGASVQLQVYGYNSLASTPTMTSLGSGTDFSFTVTDDYPFILCRLYFGSGTYSGLNAKLMPMIYRADETYTSWDAPRSSKAISLGRTVYGGKLNVTTGELTVTHSIATFNGTENWGGPDGSGNIYLALSAAGKMADRASGELTSQLKFNLLGSGGKTVGEGFVSTGGYLNCKPTGISTAADWKTLLGTTNLQVLYPLAEPVVYQLTPQEVTALLGENNIWADTGNVEVNFGEDIKDYLDKKGTGIPLDEKGQENGVATLDDYGVLSGLQGSSRVKAFTTDSTLSSADNGVFGLCQTNNVTITVPASLPDARFEITLFRWQPKTVTITPASGVTINGSSDSKTITSQFGAVLLKKISGDYWLILGDYS